MLDDDARTQLLTHTSARSSAVTTQQLADELSRRIQRLCNDLQLDAALCRWSTHANNATSKLSSVVALRHATTLAPSLARYLFSASVVLFLHLSLSLFSILKAFQRQSNGRNVDSSHRTCSARSWPATPFRCASPRIKSVPSFSSTILFLFSLTRIVVGFQVVDVDRCVDATV